MSGPNVIGIDPGLDGAVMLLSQNGELLDYFDTPTLLDGAGGRRTINAPLLGAKLRAWAPRHAFCEFVGPRPREGVVGAFSFGRSRGIIEGSLGTLGIPVEMIAPAWWKRRAGIAPGPDRKDEARSKAIARWPAQAEWFARKRDDGRAEAALLGLAAMTRGRP